MSQMRMFIETVVPELVAVAGEERVRAISAETTRRMGKGGLVLDWMKTMAAVITEGGDPDEAEAFLRGMAQFETRLRPN